jgi:hypothetical protein
VTISSLAWSPTEDTIAYGGIAAAASAAAAASSHLHPGMVCPPLVAHCLPRLADTLGQVSLWRKPVRDSVKGKLTEEQQKVQEDRAADRKAAEGMCQQRGAVLPHPSKNPARSRGKFRLQWSPTFLMTRRMSGPKAASSASNAKVPWWTATMKAQGKRAACWYVIASRQRSSATCSTGCTCFSQSSEPLDDFIVEEDQDEEGAAPVYFAQAPFQPASSPLDQPRRFMVWNDVGLICTCGSGKPDPTLTRKVSRT